MQLQVYPDGLVDFAFMPISTGLSEVYKLPLGIYQVMCDLAQSTKDPKVVRKYLEEFVSERFPGKLLNSFIDLSNADIIQLRNKGIHGLSWGMYIQVVNPAVVVSTPLLDSIANLLVK